MRGIVRDGHGSPDGLALGEIAKPVVGRDSSGRTQGDVMHSTKRLARVAGLLYLLVAIFSAFAQIVRAFARELGTTPHAYVVQCRVRLARQFLLRGQTLATAAQRAGFADQSHMTRAFVRQFGITPGRYLAARN